jgi:hypothetical protein
MDILNYGEESVSAPIKNTLAAMSSAGMQMNNLVMCHLFGMVGRFVTFPALKPMHSLTAVGSCLAG